MSYEGYRRFFCNRGHETIVDAYDDKPEKCRWCGEGFACFNSVDQTNGTTDDNGDRIDGFIELKPATHDLYPCRVCSGTGSQIVYRYDISNKNLISISTPSISEG